MFPIEKKGADTVPSHCKGDAEGRLGKRHRFANLPWPLLGKEGKRMFPIEKKGADTVPSPCKMRRSVGQTSSARIAPLAPPC